MKHAVLAMAKAQEQHLSATRDIETDGSALLQLNLHVSGTVAQYVSAAYQGGVAATKSIGAAGVDVVAAVQAETALLGDSELTAREMEMDDASSTISIGSSYESTSRTGTSVSVRTHDYPLNLSGTVAQYVSAAYQDEVAATKSIGAAGVRSRPLCTAGTPAQPPKILFSAGVVGRAPATGRCGAWRRRAGGTRLVVRHWRPPAVTVPM